MKKSCVMSRRRKQAGRQRFDAASLRHRIVHEYAEADTKIVWAIVQNEVPRLLENSEMLLKRSKHGE
ncbi:MAG: hypothetical protein AVDCRST_MAG37-1149 [uncultured Rubrobacteraceae bacterium]|uniref:DUF86 domain-containing protein n=1 Tax=uncultured Rubrobacteraceae bacterium TaxID=349277 RepID=A0A6J4QEK3_9ACTN|nr:MAG: hypothetical protein AVDCRST_MAG37-1149 [uncultured Rubrobacteraceae bacterium]